jgi:hypothetical protein
MTALEWLLDQWPILESKIPIRILEEALEMEKQQIINAANLPIEERWFDATLYKSCGEQYYNETYKK